LLQRPRPELAEAVVVALEHISSQLKLPDQNRPTPLSSSVTDIAACDEMIPRQEDHVILGREADMARGGRNFPDRRWVIATSCSDARGTALP